MQTRIVGGYAGGATPVGPVSREGLRLGVVGNVVQERPELGRVVPRAPRHPDREGPAGRCPREDMELGEVPVRLGIVVRPPCAGTEEDEARGVDCEDLLDCPEWAFGLREKVLQGERHPVAAVVLLQRVEVWNVGEPEGRLEKFEETDRPPKAQVEVRPDEEAEHEFPPRYPRPTPASLPIADRGRIHEVPQEEASKTDLLALPAVVLSPVPTVDTPTYLVSALGQGGIPSQARLADLAVELASLGLNGRPVPPASDISVHTEFVCTPDVPISRIDDVPAGFRSFDAPNFRKNLVTHTELKPGRKYDAHHVFPQQFEPRFAAYGINIHEPRFGAWFSRARHRATWYEYNQAWEDFLNVPIDRTVAEVFAFGRQMARRYSLAVYF